MMHRFVVSKRPHLRIFCYRLQYRPIVRAVLADVVQANSIQHLLYHAYDKPHP